MNATPDLSIVIVTWNGKKLVNDCLSSLLNLRESSLTYELIVVDNASTDGTPDFIERHFPDVLLVRNTANLGFAAANNIGLNLTHGQYICLLNSDVIVPSGCLATLVSFIRTHADVGLLGPQMLGIDGQVNRSTMRFPTLWSTFCRALALDFMWRSSRLFGGLLMNDFNHREPRSVEVLNGWFWMTHRTALEQVGLLDERFFIYGEDIDWSYRYHRAGWNVYFLPAASAIHLGGGSSSREKIRFYIEKQRAELQYWKKHSSALSCIAHRFTIFLHHLLRIMAFAIVYVFSPSSRDAAKYKVSRSWASLKWLANRSPSNALS